jgi:hypothetical protein
MPGLPQRTTALLPRPTQGCVVGLLRGRDEWAHNPGMKRRTDGHSKPGAAEPGTAEPSAAPPGAAAPSAAAASAAAPTGSTDESIGRPGTWREGRYQRGGAPVDQSVNKPSQSDRPKSPPAEEQKPVTWRDYEK